MKLFWATTKDGFENWFVIAENKKAAEESHEEQEGFNDGDAKALFVCDIPQDIIRQFNITSERWPTLELLEALGMKITSRFHPRKVNFQGKVFVEGTFSEMIMFNELYKSEGVYVIRVQNTNKYKIGRTTNVKKRIKQITLGNPDNIKLDYFVKTMHSLSLESHIHEVFKNNRIDREWFTLDDNDFMELEAHFALLQFRLPEEFKVYNIRAVSIQGRVYD